MDFPTSVQLLYKIRKLPNWIDDRPASFRCWNSLLGAEAREVHQRDDTRRASSVSTSKTMSHDVVSMGQCVRDEVQDWLREGYGLLVTAHPSVVARDVKPEVLDFPAALMIEGHGICTIDHMSDIMLH